MAKYGQQDVTFPSTREAKFVNTLSEAIDAGDKEAFTAAVFEYDQVCVDGNSRLALAHLFVFRL